MLIIIVVGDETIERSAGAAFLCVADDLAAESFHFNERGSEGGAIEEFGQVVKWVLEAEAGL